MALDCRTNNVVVISDTHCGCRLALCDPKGHRLDDGGTYKASPLQKKIYSMWREFWDVVVPETVKGEPYVVVHNGDAIDGTHHGSTTQISQNLDDQEEIAYQVLAPIVDKAQAYFHIRGTEAHVGKSAVSEERLARRLGAVPNEDGQFARWDLWKTIGPKGDLIHLLHHVGSTGSQHYEATAPYRELMEEMLEAARWQNRRPSVIVRSHRHRALEISAPVGNSSEHETGMAMAVITPCWQAKTPFAWKIPGARLSTPQFGGTILRYHEKDNVLFNRLKVWTVGRTKTT